MEREGRRRRAAGTVALWREDGVDEEVPPRRRFDLHRRFGETERRRGHQRALSVASVGGLASSRPGAPEAPAPPLPPEGADAVECVGSGVGALTRGRCSQGLPVPLHPTTAALGPCGRPLQRKQRGRVVSTKPRFRSDAAPPRRPPTTRGPHLSSRADLDLVDPLHARP